MSERDDYPEGVPCWVDTLQPNPFAAIQFYESLFGWKFVTRGSVQRDPPRDYYVAQLRGRDVAGVGFPFREDGSFLPTWTTHIRVASASLAAKEARAARGKVLIEPFDVVNGGRMAVLADPAGAVFAVWEPRQRRGARLVNEAGAWALSTLSTNEAKRSEVFYGSLFGWKTEGVGDGGLKVFRLCGYIGGQPRQTVPRDVVAVMQPLIDPEQSPHWGVDFWVDDVDDTAEHAADLGGTVVQAPRDSGMFRYAVLADSQGARFTVSRMTDEIWPNPGN